MNGNDAVGDGVKEPSLLSVAKFDGRQNRADKILRILTLFSSLLQALVHHFKSKISITALKL